MLYNYNEILSIFKNDYNIHKAIESKKIFKIERGIYSDGKENFTLYELLLKKYPNSFLVKDSALFHIGFLSEEPEKVHLGTNRNSLRIKDNRVKQHFYKNFNNEFISDTNIEHILSKSNIHSYITNNNNEIRLLNITALLYDLFRNETNIQASQFKTIIEKFKSCPLLYKFDSHTVRSNLKHEQVYDINYELLYELDFIAWDNDFDRRYDM